MYLHTCTHTPVEWSIVAAERPVSGPSLVLVTLALTVWPHWRSTYKHKHESMQ